MKKIFVLALFLFNTLNFNAFALDYASYCSSNYPEVIKPDFKGNLVSFTGLNFLSRKIAQREIAKTLKEATNTKFKVKMDNFRGVALTDGIFKNLEFTGKNITYEDMTISNLSAKTICPYNYITLEDDKIVFKENMVLSYNLDISEQDLNKALESASFTSAIEKINKGKFLSSILKINKPQAKLEEGKISLQYTIVPTLQNNNLFAFAKNSLKPVDINLKTGLEVKDNKIELCNLDINSQKLDPSYLLPFVNMFNPMNKKIKIDKDNTGDLKIDEVKISSSKITIKGAIIVPSKAE